VGQRKKHSDQLGVAEDAGTRTIQAGFRAKAKLLDGGALPASTKTFEELNEAYKYLMENRPKDKALPTKFAAILSADVAGYSKMMAANEEETLKFFYFCKSIFEDVIRTHGGRVFNTAGDAILSEYDSVSTAVTCAMAVQREMRAVNRGQPDGRKIQFRMGVNMGEVYVHENDLLGDAVNIAARVQTAAAPAGICITGTVYDCVKTETSGAIVFLGEKSFKNIPEKVRTYALTDVDGKYRFEESSHVSVAKGAAVPPPPPAPGKARTTMVYVEKTSRWPLYAAAILCAGTAAGVFFYFKQQKVAAPVAQVVQADKTVAAMGKPGTVVVKSNPEAEITFSIAGKEIFKGNTPFSHDLESGPYKVHAENAALQLSENQDINVEAGKYQELNFNLFRSNDTVASANPSLILNDAQFQAYSASADSGDAEAMVRLGRHHLAKQEIDQAFQIFKLGAAKGQTQAEFELGKLYATGGKGVTKDISLAGYWLLTSAFGGIHEATEYLLHNTELNTKFKEDIAHQSQIDGAASGDPHLGHMKERQRSRLDDLRDDLQAQHAL
jgi:class 3 adenylate cyclase